MNIVNKFTLVLQIKKVLKGKIGVNAVYLVESNLVSNEYSIYIDCDENTHIIDNLIELEDLITDTTYNNVRFYYGNKIPQDTEKVF